VGVLRDPIEFLYTLHTYDAQFPNTIAGIAGQNPVTAARWFVRHYRDRVRLMERLPRDRRILVTYESLVHDPEETMGRIAAFSGVDFHPCMLEPTKNGTPWAGNSIRGVVSEKIFASPAVARDELDPEVLSIVEGSLKDIMVRYGYPLTGQNRHVSRLSRRGDLARASLRRQMQRADRRLGASFAEVGPLGRLANSTVTTARRGLTIAGPRH
jgi:hypothetical protein